jgi:hypothetical protein
MHFCPIRDKYYASELHDSQRGSSH